MQFYLKLLIILVLLTLTLVLSCLVYKTDSNSEGKRVLKFPRFFRLVPFLLFCFTVICSICILLFQFEEWPYILLLFGVFGLPSLIMFILWSIWRVDIKEDGFIYRNYFGKKNEYKYAELEYQLHPKGLKWYFYKNNKKVLCVAYYVNGGDTLDRLYHKYISRHRKDIKE
ncbi:MAG: hypothetical protein K2J01_07650 [Clostridiales bacterium]|nr:hypothetical protein [Clostridiales bacterium]